MNLYNETNRPTPWLMQLTAWGVLFVIPFFFSGREGQSVTLNGYLRFVLMPISMMIVYYVNTYFLIGRYLFTKRPTQFVITNAILFIVCMLAVHVGMMTLEMYANHPSPPADWRMFVGIFVSNLAIYSLVSGLSVAIKMTAGWYKIEAERKELEKNKVEAELQNLKSQLNPHFLFNTLNNIYSLIAFSPDRAQEAVHDLSYLLRYVMYDSSQPEVSLTKEIDFIRNYVELMRIRLPQNVQLDVHLPVDVPAILLAPLLFISPIENAFKHGVSNMKPSFIRITIEADESKVGCFIQNSLFPKDAKDKSGSGIGLTNLKRRLSLLYPDKFAFEALAKEDIYVCKLVLYLK